MRRAILVLAVSALVLANPAPARGQESLDPGLIDLCQDAFLPDTNGYDLCHDAVASAQLLQPQLGMLLSGGNPVLGTASPIGTKFRFMPRFNIGGRVGFGRAAIPDLLDYPENRGDPTGSRSFSITVAQLDLSVGVFEGLRLGTTLGGLASVEVLASLAAIMLPDGAGFQGNATGVGLGARVGILRESFTAPGISISGMYKWHGRVDYGDTAEGDAASFEMDMEALSLRAGLSKSFVSFGLALTLGYDSYWSDLAFVISPPPAGPPVALPADAGTVGLQTERWSAFLDFSYIVLYFNIVAEVGWQEEEGLTSSREDEFESGNFLGSLGIRLTL
ncbi:MAG: hypothetical protein JSW46_17360 [Gemmatimonadota bacterium]|nr:MAG: hypothetical protein JSW46_17360 [Gemmatimonadota bacterium]